jgi:syntaxin 16
MATRSRTLLFVQYRNTYARQPHGRRSRPFESMAEDASLLPDSKIGRDGDEVAIEMSALPPKW